MNVFRIDAIEIDSQVFRTMKVPLEIRLNINDVKARGTHFREDGAETDITVPLTAEEYEDLRALLNRITARVDAQLSKL